MSQETQDRVIRVIHEVTELPCAEIAAAAALVDLPNWDSLMHLNMVLGLEREFGINFNIMEMTEVNSVGAAVRLIEAKTA
jgi:acyl carrier protein